MYVMFSPVWGTFLVPDTLFLLFSNPLYFIYETNKQRMNSLMIVHLGGKLLMKSYKIFFMNCSYLEKNWICKHIFQQEEGNLK